MNLSEKELQLLEAYRDASSIEKQRVENILKIQEQTEPKKLEVLKWSDKCTGSILMKLLGVEKDEVSRLIQDMDYRKLIIICEELRNSSEASQQKIKEMCEF